MRVGIDAHCLGQKKTGNETYTYNLVKYLSRLDSNGIDYTVFVGGDVDQGEQLFSNGTFRAKQIRPLNPLLRIPMGFAIQTRAEKLNVFHAQYLLPHHLKCRTVLTVHDVLYERFPQFFTKSDYYRHHLVVPWSCHRADHIITVSESSKRDLVDLYDLDPQRITVTYLGPDDCYYPLDRAQSKKKLSEHYQIENDIILYVGAIQPRKNIPRLLSAFAQLKREKHLPHKLVIVGPKAWLSADAFRSLDESPVRQDIYVTGYVPRSHLPFFYNAADVFVYVSLCEGFGLPIIEAMACGTPTVTSRGSSLEEIAGDAAILVDPTDTDAIASAIESVVSDSELRARFSECGLKRSQNFSCHKMALQTRQVYQRLLA